MLVFISWIPFNITDIYNLVIAPFWPIAVFPAPNSHVACKRSSSNWPSTNDWWNVVGGFSHTSVPEDFEWPTFNFWSTDQWQPAMVIPGIPLLWRVTRTWVWLTNGRPSRDGQRWSVEEFPQRQSHWPMGGRRSDRWSQFPPTKTTTTHQPTLGVLLTLVSDLTVKNVHQFVALRIMSHSNPQCFPVFDVFLSFTRISS